MTKDNILTMEQAVSEVDEAVSCMFGELANSIKLDTGDLTVKQQMALQEHYNGIAKIVLEWVNQNS